MSYAAELKIPKSKNGNLKYYVYRSKDATNINTIAKIKTVQPILILDEAKYIAVNGDTDVYVILDNLTNAQAVAGVTYLGPEPALIPVTEYEVAISFRKYNDYSYSPIVKLNPLESSFNGTIFYYSVIGVDEGNNLITHLSKVNAVVIQSDYQETGTREIMSCNDYSGLPEDIWNSIATIDWATEINIGDTSNPLLVNRFGYPFVETVPIFESSDIIAESKYASMFNQIFITIPNIWQGSNKKYNTRKMKSYKIRNIYDGKYGDFSIPNMQSVMPLTIEKLVVLRKNVTGLTEAEQTIPCVNDGSDTNVENPLTIIRKNGVYYNYGDHSALSVNKPAIQPNEPVALYTESSVQSAIKLTFEAQTNKTYNYTFYLYDVYGKKSEPVTILIET